MGNMMTDGVIGSHHNKNKIKQNKEKSEVLLQCVQLRGPQKEFRKRVSVVTCSYSIKSTAEDMRKQQDVQM